MSAYSDLRQEIAHLLSQYQDARFRQAKAESEVSRMETGVKRAERDLRLKREFLMTLMQNGVVDLSSYQSAKVDVRAAEAALEGTKTAAAAAVAGLVTTTRQFDQLGRVLIEKNALLEEMGAFILPFKTT